jgi:hypothetical protein
MPMETTTDYKKLYDRIVSQAARTDIPPIQRQRYQKMLDKYNELRAQGVDPATAVQKAYSSGNISYAMQREKQAVAAGDTSKVKFFQMMRGHALTMTQKGQNIAMATNKPSTARPATARGGGSLTPLRESAGKKVHGKLYEIFMFEIAGILCFFIPPFFGLPPLTWLAWALMVFIPAFSSLPSESQVLNSIRTGNNIGVSWGSGSLVAKSVCKITAFILIIFQCFELFAVFRFAAIVIAMLFYFPLPTHYKTSQPYRMIEAWFRMALGFIIAIILGMVFGGFGPGSGLANMGTAFVAVGFAFFVTLPVHIPDEESGVVKINLLDNLSSSKGYQALDKILFSIFMGVALFSFMGPIGWLTDASHIIFYLFFGLSFFVGVSTGPEGRPALGVIMIFIMLFILSTSYTGFVGQAVFGYWWPQIYNFGQTYLGPLNTAWAQAQSSMGDAWEMMTCPQCYIIKQQQRAQVTKSVITTGGTPMSIEMSRFELTPTLLEPSEPVIGVIELQNSGHFISGKMVLDLWSTYPSPVTTKEYATGEVANLQCSVAGPPASYTITTTVNSSTTTGTAGSCSWDNKTYPTETRAVTFKMQEGIGSSGNPAWGPLYGACQDNSNSSSPEPCNCFGVGPFSKNCDLSIGNITYYYGGRGVKVYANLTYRYVVNVSLPVSAIGLDEYLKELQAGDITLQDFTSEYTGGPVKATLFTQQQPARNDIPFIVIAAIYNDGSGEIVNITDFKITVYGGGMVYNVVPVGFDFRTLPPCGVPPCSTPPTGCGSVDTTTSPGNFIITCQNLWKPLKPGEYKRVSFYVYTNESITDKRTTLIVGIADYTYKKTTSQMLTMANAPPQ